MSKHNLESAEPLPPAKRIHLDHPTTHIARLPLHVVSLEQFSDEIIYSIFAYLDYVDLCRIQSTCRTWARLSLDNELWKSVYLANFGGRTRLKGTRGFMVRPNTTSTTVQDSGRVIKPLPGRALAHDDLPKNWKWMFRISSNWRTGRCSVESLGAPETTTSQDQQEVDSDYTSSRMHLLLTNSLTIAASSQISSNPEIMIHGGKPSKYILQVHSTALANPTSITCLAVDQAPPSSHGHTIRLAAFMSNNQFTIFELDLRTLERSCRRLTFAPNPQNGAHHLHQQQPRLSAVRQAAYHHPLLVSLTDAFSLRLYDLSGNQVVHTQTLSSFTSYPPTSLVLSKPIASSTYKLVLAYSIPVYPAHWSVGATELLIAGASGEEHGREEEYQGRLPTSQEVLSSLIRSGPSHSEATSMTAISSRSARSVDVPQGWIDERKLQAMREQWGRKVKRVAETRTDGRWVILAPGEDGHRLSSPTSSWTTAVGSGLSEAVGTTSHDPTTLQLYKLSMPSNPTTSAIPKLVFVRSLHGQTGQITALALSDGRCVSLSENGAIWVWDLEADSPGAEVSQSGLESRIGPTFPSKGNIVFDDRTIVSAACGSEVVQIRRFDV